MTGESEISQHDMYMYDGANQRNEAVVFLQLLGPPKLKTFPLDACSHF